MRRRLAAAVLVSVALKVGMARAVAFPLDPDARAVCLLVSPALAISVPQKAAVLAEANAIWQPHDVVVREGRRCGTEAAECNPIIAIRVEDPSRLARPDLLRAEELVSEIYQQAGVTLRWTVDETTRSDRTLTVVLTISATALAGVTTDSMGVAPSPGDGARGTTAYVFIDRVKAFASSHRIAVKYVLACALAHEIGHLLLPPNAHRPDGIMRDSWHPALFPPRTPGVLGFPPEQARLLRLRARRQ